VPLDRLWFHSARTRLWGSLSDEVIHTPVEPILHPSRSRLQWLGVFTFVGQFLFAGIWGYLMPQPYENITIRALLAFLGLVFLIKAVNRDPASTTSAWVYVLIFWLELPLFFSWMYLMNGGNKIWLASLASMVLIYYHITDWRVATLGTLSGLLGGFALYSLQGSQGIDLSSIDKADLTVLGFAWSMSIMLGMSSANLRRTRLLNTLSTMAVMAHELRTPLATVNLMGDVLQTLAQNDVPDGKKKKLEELAARLQGLVRSMNRQIDTQISNAQLLRLPRDQSPVMAAALAHEVVSNYPYRSSRERDCVRVTIQQDFCFVASPQLFAQVLTNLLKNALHSLASASNAPNPGDLRIDVGLHHGRGRIAVSDDGVGIPHEQQQRIFEPFFSTQPGAGNGLGLTFCKNVVEAAQGRISLHSEPSMGAVFMIDLPLISGTP
jgi:two-component system, CAI-1 autoinducer sensor kinase/phosphatase CqsS